MSFDGLMEHLCYIGTRSGSVNTLGETTYAWTYSTSTTKCRFSPITAAKKLELSGEFDDVIFNVFLPSGAAVTTNTRLKYNNKNYIVKDSHLDSNFHHMSCLVSEL